MKFENLTQARRATNLSYLGGVSLSAKMIKNEKFGVMTYSLNLSPANTSGYDVCKFSTPECRMGCLATSGHAAINIYSGITTISDARIKKTRLFFEEQEFFMNWLIAELKMFQNKARNNGMIFTVRLNTISDIDWANVRHYGLNIFEIFPEISFYDYTKDPNKFQNKPANYHLTFSHTGKNWSVCQALLKQGHNIAMVFNVHKESELPKTFASYVVINGDESDNRINDNKGVIVGLKWKRIADKKAESQVLNSCFVIQPTDQRINIGVGNNVQAMVLE